MFTDKENFRRLCCLLVCFALACKNQLAGDSIEVDSEYLLSRGLISMKELKHVISRPGWQESPRLYCFVTRTHVALANVICTNICYNRLSFVFVNRDNAHLPAILLHGCHSRYH